MQKSKVQFKSQKFIILITIFAAFTAAIPGFAYDDRILDLQREEAAAERQEAEFLGCYKGWLQFLTAGIGYENFRGYISEIFECNPCYRADMDMMRNQVDKIRRQIRSTFLRCDTKNLQAFTKQYYKLEAELFFLQSMLLGKGFFKSCRSGPVLDRISDPDQLRSLVNDMKSTYPMNAGSVTEQELQQYVEEFVVKYKTRLNDYKQCRSDYYEELTAKWNELVDNFKDFAEVFEGESDREKARREKAEELRKRAGYEPSAGGARSGPVFGIGEDLDLNLKLARLKVSPEKTMDDFVETMTKGPRIPGGGGGGLSAREAGHAVESEKARVFEEKSRAEMEAKFELLYAEMSDSAVLEITKIMDDLILIVKDTVPVMDEVEECVDETEARECKNKK